MKENNSEIKVQLDPEILKVLRGSGKVTTILHTIYAKEKKFSLIWHLVNGKRKLPLLKSKETMFIRIRQAIQNFPPLLNDIIEIWIKCQIEDISQQSIPLFPLEAWDSILIVHYLGLYCNAPQSTYPNADDIQNSLAEDATCVAIKSRYEKSVAILNNALYPIILIEFHSKRIIERYNAVYNKLMNAGSPKNMADVLGARKECAMLWCYERGFRKFSKMLKCGFAFLHEQGLYTAPALLQDEKTDTILLAVCQETNKLVTDIKAAMEHCCVQPFDAQAVIDLLAGITPPLEPQDMERAAADVQTVADSGENEASFVLNVMLPVLRGERECPSGEEEPRLKDFSLGFYMNFSSRKFTLPAVIPSETYNVASSEGIISKKPLGTVISEHPALDCSRKRLSKSKKVLPVQKTSGTEQPEPIASSLGGMGKNEHEEEQLPLEHKTILSFPKELAETQSSDVFDEPKIALGLSVSDGSVRAGAPTNREQQLPSPLPDMIPDMDSPTMATRAGYTACHCSVSEDQTSLTVPESTEVAYMIRLLNEGDTCRLYWLAKSSGSTRIPAWLAELMHLGTHLQPHFVKSRSRIEELTDIATRHVDDVTKEQGLLLAASLLRPALVAPALAQQSLLGTLGYQLREYQCQPLLQALAAFVGKLRPLHESLFVGLEEETQRENWHSALRGKTGVTLERCRTRKISYQRATAVLKHLFGPVGVFAKTLQGFLDGKLSLPQDFSLEDWRDQSKREARIGSIDKQINKITDAYSPIRYLALNTLEKEIMDACDLIEEWHRFYEGTGKLALDNNFSYRELKEIAVLAKPEALPETPFAKPLCQQIESLGANFGVQRGYGSVDPLDMLRLWPITLLGSDPLHKEIFVPLEEILHSIDANVNISTFLKEAPAALVTHLDKGHLGLVQTYLDLVPGINQIEIDGQTWALRLKNLRLVWIERFKSEIETCRNAIEGAYLRGIIQSNQEIDLNQKLDSIHMQYSDPEKSAMGIKRLHEDILKKIEKEEGVQKDEVQNVLDELQQGQHLPQHAVDSVQRLLNAGECSAAHDMLAQMKDYANTGKELPPLDVAETTNATDAHDFYAALKSNSIQPVSSDETTLWEAIAKSSRELIAPTIGRSPSALLTQRITKLLRWIGFSLEQTEKAEAVHNEGAPCFWRIVRYRMSITCPIPRWGSAANQTHVVGFGWKVTPDSLQRLLENLFRDKLDKTHAITFFCFTPLSYADRMLILIQCARSYYTPVIVDINLLHWLQQHSSNALERTSMLFNIGLAAARCNPYTPEVAGAVPPEMFFGREKDIEALWDPFGPCIVYGGRQLGKTALLRQVCKRYHAPERNIHALWHSMKPTETSMIEIVISLLVQADIIHRNTNHKTLTTNIDEYLEKHPGARILILFDECDKILDIDIHNDDLKGITIFRDLMAKTQRRFKIVLTGLHSVQRFSHLGNSPLHHFGEPLCVGPLPPDAARKLVVLPMKVLGMEFENPTLVSKVLTHSNYHPCLIQLFCQELVRYVHEQQKNIHEQQDPNIPCIITQDIISRVYSIADLRKKILSRFDWTLDLDKRYRVIGYSMAFIELLQRSSGGSCGSRFSELLAELKNNWPDAFKNADRTTVESLLQEMVGLGVVSSLGGLYRLRTPNIINLLGGEDQILERLAEFRDTPYALFDSSDEVRPKNGSALVVSQFNTLSSKQSGLVLICGSSALGMKRVPDTLKYICTEKHMRIQEVTGVDLNTIEARIKKEYEAVNEGGMLLWFRADETTHAIKALEWSCEWLQSLRTDKKIVKIACLLDPNSMVTLEEKETSLDSSYVTSIYLRLWTEHSIAQWHHDQGTAPRIAASDLIHQTGGWDGLIMPHLDSNILPIALCEDNNAFPNFPWVRTLLCNIYDLGSGESVSFEDYWAICKDDLQPSYDVETMRRMLDVLISLRVLQQDENGVVVDTHIVDCLKMV